MAKIAKILPLPVDPKPGEMTMQNALAERGYMRHPGTGVGFPPLRLPNGKYKTGLDENADYILRMPKEMREMEQEIVKERRNRLELATGIISDPANRDNTGLGPRAPYYSGVFDTGKVNTHEVASRVKLVDGENVFNFNNAFKEVEFWWVIQNDALIAPSQEKWRAGGCKPTVQFYISNPEAEAEVVYNKKRATAKAIQYLEKMSLERRLKVAKLLGLPVTDSDKEQIVYNQLSNFIEQKDVKFGEYKGQDTVRLFNQLVELSPDVLHVKSLVREAINLRVYITKGVGGALYEGDRIVAQNEAELVKDLSMPQRQMDLRALEIKVMDKQKVKTGLSGIEFTPPLMANKTPEPVVEPTAELQTVKKKKELTPEQVQKKQESMAKARAVQAEKRKQRQEA